MAKKRPLSATEAALVIVERIANGESRRNLEQDETLKAGWSVIDSAAQQKDAPAPRAEAPRGSGSTSSGRQFVSSR